MVIAVVAVITESVGPVDNGHPDLGFGLGRGHAAGAFDPAHCRFGIARPGIQGVDTFGNIPQRTVGKPGIRTADRINIK